MSTRRPRAMVKAAHAAKAAKVLVVATVGAVVLSGCTSVYDLPLPGGPDTGADPMTITVEFADVLDLVPQSTVKVNDVSVGKVTAIDLDGYTAEVDLEIRRDVELPDNARASLRQTSLLGEKFVSLEPPAQGASSNPLEDGDLIPLERSGRNPEVEEVLGALSLILNGGGVAQLKTITQELNNALEGREGAAKSVLHQLREFMGQLDTNKQDIVAAIESLNRLALSAERQLPTIDAAMEQLPSALRSIDRQRDDLVKMLRSLNRLSDVSVEVIRASKASTIDALKQLSPVLDQLAASGDNFVKAFHVFLTYPFVDEVVGRDPQVARNLHMGDYTNLSITLDVEVGGDRGSIPDPVETACTTLRQVKKQLEDGGLDDVIGQITAIDDLCDGAQDIIEKCLAKAPGEIATCLENRLGVTIDRITQGVLDRTCELLQRPAGCLDLGGSGGGGGGGDGGGLLGLPIPRPGFGPTTGPAGDPRGPTYGELMDAYDPALVKLLVPGMVTQ